MIRHGGRSRTVLGLQLKCSLQKYAGQPDCLRVVLQRSWRSSQRFEVLNECLPVLVCADARPEVMTSGSSGKKGPFVVVAELVGRPL